MRGYIFVFLAVFCVYLQMGESIVCFDCNSRNDTKCALEKPPETFRRNCSDLPEGFKYVLCRKIVQTIEHEVNGLEPDTRVIRSCGWDNTSYLNKCYQRSGFGGRQEVCSCTTDMCNSSTQFLPGFILVLAAAAFSFLE